MSTRATRVEVDPGHGGVEVHPRHGGVQVDGRDDLVEVDVLLDEPGEVEPLDDQRDDGRRPRVEQHLGPPAQLLAVGRSRAGQAAEERGGVVARRQQRRSPEQPRHRRRHAVHGAHRHHGGADRHPGHADGDVERQPRLGPQLGHR